MTKKELNQFVEMVEKQFNQNKDIIIEGYQEYLKNGDTYEHKTMCIESWGVAMIGANNEHISHLPFKELYNFINSFKGFAQTRPHYAFEQKPDCYIEYYTDNFLIQSENLGVKKLLNTLQD